VYGRRYAGRELTFEASGGLVNSSLVLQDRETDSYWSIMHGSATAGALRGTVLEELPGSEKRRWSDWRKRHPDTKVLSVGGREHAADVYAGYWTDRRGYRGQRAKDTRLPTKAPIFAFRRAEQDFAVEHSKLDGGRVVALGDGDFAFFFRPPGEPPFGSTSAFRSRAGFVREGSRWTELETGARFDPERRAFLGGDVQRLKGIDTFWYNWSLNNPGSHVLE